jgi:hypothetical protein
MVYGRAAVWLRLGPGSVSPAGGRRSRIHRLELPMLDTARLFNGARCGRQVAICRHGNQGQRYCGPGGAQAARRLNVTHQPKFGN